MKERENNRQSHYYRNDRGGRYEQIMEKHIIGENGIGYTLGADGLYYSDLELSEGTHYEIGRYGRMRWEYLKTHRRGEIYQASHGREIK